MVIFLSAALAGPPLHGDGLIDVGSGTVERLSWTADGRYVLGRDRGTGSGFVVDVDDWRVERLEDCSVTAVTSATVGSDAVVFVGCDNGRILPYDRTPSGLERRLDGDGNGVYWQLDDVDGNPASKAIPTLAWNRSSTDPWLYALLDETTPTLHVLDVTTGATDDDVVAGYPYNAAGGGLVGTVVGTSDLYIVHGDTDTSIITLSTGAVALSPQVVGGQLYTVSDVTLAGTASALWVADADRDALYRYTPRQGTYQTPVGTGFGDPTVLARNGTTDDTWMLVGSASRIASYAMTGDAFDDLNTPVWEDSAPASTVVDLLAGPAYSFGGTDDGSLRVFSDRPWIDQATLEPAVGVPGDTTRFSFRIADAGVNWQVRRGEDWTDQTGTVLEAGTTSSPDEVVTVELTVGEAWEEGANGIYVFGAGSNLLEGHARADFVVDTVPEPPVLTEDAAGFLDGGLELGFQGISDADLDHYDVYVSREPFTPEDYPDGGGPEAWTDGPTLPITVAAIADAFVTVPIRPLENGTTYYLAVRAVDSGGLESAMSNVVTGVPEPAYTASSLAGETGGSSCSTSPAGGPFALAFGLLAVLARRGRGLALLGGLLSASAMAAEDEEKQSRKGDMSKQVGNFEIRYGTFLQLQDEAIQEVYGDRGHEMLQVEFGPQLTRFVELDLEAGFYQELATTVSSGGAASNQKTMLTWLPLGASASLRLHVVDEQLIVPFAKVGMDYVYFSELTDNAEGSGKDRVGGSKVGNHYALGANILLDVFARGRASLLEAQTGINDTYITVEYRRQNIDSRPTPFSGAVKEGFDLSGNLLTIGLKLDY